MDIKDITGLLKKSDNATTMKGDDFSIGNGVVTCDNVVIPIDSISFIETCIQEKKKYGQLPLFAFAGFIIACIPAIVFTVVGIAVMTFMLINIILIFLKNRKQVYLLQFQGHSGRYFTIASNDEDFLMQMKDAVVECISDRSKSYNINIKTEAIVQENNTTINNVKGDQIMDNGQKYTAGGDILTQGAIKNDSGYVVNGGQGDITFGDKVGGDMIKDGSSKTTNIVNNNIISDDEWQLLREFAANRKKDFSEGDRNFIICNNLEVYAREKNSGKCKELLKKAGVKAMDIILSVGASNALAGIIAKLK